MANIVEEIKKRRTFAIISHPDAGKTTLTEKLLLFGGAIHVAGAVKSNKIKKTATSDWMEIEKQRGISVATSVMGFEYEGYKINILDTPGHQDFAEDTFRTLTAVDSVIIVVDAAKGVEQQTRRLMEVCRMRNTPVIIFVNKMDREGRDPFDILDELEAELKISVRPLSWPINGGANFKGVYNIYEHNLSLFAADKQRISDRVDIEDINDPVIDQAEGARSCQGAHRLLRAAHRGSRAVHAHPDRDPRQVPRGIFHAHHAPVYDAHSAGGRRPKRRQGARHGRKSRSGRLADDGGARLHRGRHASARAAPAHRL